MTKNENIAWVIFFSQKCESNLVPVSTIIYLDICSRECYFILLDHTENRRDQDFTTYPFPGSRDNTYARNLKAKPRVFLNEPTAILYYLQLPLKLFLCQLIGSRNKTCADRTCSLQIDALNRKHLLDTHERSPQVSITIFKRTEIRAKCSLGCAVDLFYVLLDREAHNAYHRWVLVALAVSQQNNCGVYIWLTHYCYEIKKQFILSDILTKVNAWMRTLNLSYLLFLFREVCESAERFCK